MGIEERVNRLHKASERRLKTVDAKVELKKKLDQQQMEIEDIVQDLDAKEA